jgi:hypothetical protein
MEILFVESVILTLGEQVDLETLLLSNSLTQHFNL